MADLAERIGGALRVPVVAGVTAAVKLFETLVALVLRTSKVRDLAFPLPKAYSGLVEPFAPGRTESRPTPIRRSTWVSVGVGRALTIVLG